MVSLSGELRTNKVQGLLQEIGDAAAEEEALAALQATGWDVQAAARQIKLNRLIRLVRFSRLDIGGMTLCLCRVARF